MFITFKRVVFLVILFTSANIFASENESFLKVLKDIKYPKPDTNSLSYIENCIISHHNLSIHLDSGSVVFFKPVTFDSTDYYFGAYFEGFGKFRFSPSVKMESEHLERLFGSDSLNREFDNIYLLFTKEIYDNLKSHTIDTTLKLEYNNGKLKNWAKFLRIDANFNYAYETLRSNLYPIGRPFLTAVLDPKHTDKIIFTYNPYLQEEIVMLKEFHQPGISYMEDVISYSQFNNDESYANINGRSKDQLKTIHYDIDAEIDDKGYYKGKTEVSFEVISGPLHTFPIYLYKRLIIDSILNQDGEQVIFDRAKLDVTFKDYEDPAVFLFLNDSYNYKDTLKLSFYLRGEVVEKDYGEFYVLSGAEWYPRYGFRQLASFDINFKTPRQYTFTATGIETERKKIADTLFTKYKVLSPSSNISFNIGNMEKYKFESDDIVPVEVYFSEQLHKDIAAGLAYSLVSIGKDMEKQVAEDVQNSLRVYQHYFGPYTYDNLKVSEILASHGEAFPGFVHLGFSTWINTDNWGNDRIFRAHEVAHQWWGVGVGYQTYHDQWLSEGFATYSSLLYYQEIAGVDKFLDKLKEYRNDIFSARKYIFSSGEEAGPIALGYRTSTSKTRGDYNLIIYKKGAYVLHMLRNLLIDLKTMNEDNFLNMMREFYQANRGKNVTTRDFQIIAEKYAGIKLDWFFKQWVYGNDLPDVDFSYEYVQNADNSFTAKCHVVTKNVSDDFKMYYPLEIEIEKDKKTYIRIFVEGPDFTFELPGLPHKLKKIKLNPFESVLAKVKQ